MALNTSMQDEKVVFASMLKKPDYLLEVKKDFFNNEELQYVAATARDFYKEYREAPSCEQMKLLLKDNPKGITNETVDNIYNADVLSTDAKFLEDAAEGWIMWRAYNTNIVRSVTYAKTADVTLENVKEVVKKATEMVAETNLIAFDKNMGKSFFDVDSHRSVNEYKIPFTWDYWNKISRGGLDPKTLHVYIGFTNVGKSIVLCNDAAEFVRRGKNVLFISCEMSEEKVLRRIGANLFDMTLDEYDKMVENPSQVKKKLKILNDMSFMPLGKLFVKQYPTGQCTALDVERYVKEIEEQEKFKVDVVVADYLGIMCDYRNPNTENTYLKGKHIAEDLRAVAIKYDLIVDTAAQIGRSAGDSSDINITDVSESMGVMHTADSSIGLIQTEEMRYGVNNFDSDNKPVPYYWFKLLKVREGEGKDTKFKVNIDYNKMKLIETTEVINTNDHMM